MAHSKKVLAGKSRQARSDHRAEAQQITEDQENLKQANELQVELARRAQIPAGKDPLLTFDSSMSREQVRAKMKALLRRSKEAVIA